MTQHRDAPAYQEYASSMLSRIDFRTMSLRDRGLLYTMRMECWVNERLPANHSDLAKVLGMQVEEVAAAMSAVMSFFEVVDNFIICPELDDYKQHLAERRQKQSQGGKTGSSITNGKRKKRAEASLNKGDSSTSASSSQVPCRGKVESLVKQSTVKQSQIHSNNKDSYIETSCEKNNIDGCTSGDYLRSKEGW